MRGSLTSRRHGMAGFKYSLRDLFIAAVLIIAGFAVLQSRFASSASAGEISPDANCGCDCSQ
jgi:hypothetical protein